MSCGIFEDEQNKFVFSWKRLAVHWISCHFWHAERHIVSSSFPGEKVKCGFGFLWCRGCYCYWLTSLNSEQEPKLWYFQAAVNVFRCKECKSNGIKSSDILNRRPKKPNSYFIYLSQIVWIIHWSQYKCVKIQGVSRSSIIRGNLITWQS